MTKKVTRMRIVQPQIITNNIDNLKLNVYKNIADAARTCYISEANSTEENDLKLIKKLIKNHHEAMLEHASITVGFVTDRGITHELVRHRIASFAQESTRYCRYSDDKFGNEITYVDIKDALDIDPVTSKLDAEKKMLIVDEWISACEDAEKHYLKMIDLGCSPQMARSVLNNSTKSKIVVTANIREWRHILKLRAVGTTGKPHPQMVQLMSVLLSIFAKAMPELFGDLVADNSK